MEALHTPSDTTHINKHLRPLWNAAAVVVVNIVVVAGTDAAIQCFRR